MEQNRPIKFRGWHKDQKKMYSAEELGADQLTLNPDGRGFINVHSVDVSLSTFITAMIPLQYIGLKDKNNKEIYEGDIVRTYMGNICEIRWDFVRETTKNANYDYTGFCFHHIKQNRNYHLDVTSSAEVIGNIYENPELLK